VPQVRPVGAVAVDDEDDVFARHVAR
jgi:hypothetical protein